MKPILAVVADAANITSDGKLNVLGVFENILTESTPCVHLEFYVVVMVRCDVGDKGNVHRISLKLTDADRAEIGKSNALDAISSHDDPNPHPILKAIFRLRGVSFPAFGQYTFHVVVDESEVAEIDLFVQPFPHRVAEG